MTLTFLLLSVIPLIAFVIVDFYAGYRWGIIAAMALAILAFVANIVISGEVDVTHFPEPVLIIVLGYATLKLKNQRYFKFQPAITDAILALILAYFQLFSTPLFQKYLPLMKKMAETATPEVQEMLASPTYFAMLGTLSGALIVVFLIHGLLMWYTALSKSNWLWIGARLSIYPFVLLTAAIVFSRN